MALELDNQSEDSSLLNTSVRPAENSLQAPGIRPKVSPQAAKTQFRMKLGDLLSSKGFNAIRRLLVKAENGELRDSDQIKLLDLLMKYSVGPITTQEITGENGAPVQIQFSFGTNKPEADLYLQDVRRRAQELAAQTQRPRLVSDNRSSDDPQGTQAVDGHRPVSAQQEADHGQK